MRLRDAGRLSVCSVQLSSARGVTELLKAVPEAAKACSWQGRPGKLPLHYAAELGAPVTESARADRYYSLSRHSNFGNLAVI